MSEIHSNLILPTSSVLLLLQFCAVLPEPAGAVIENWTELSMWCDKSGSMNCVCIRTICGIVEPFTVYFALL